MNERLQNIYNRHEKSLEEWYEDITYYQQHFILPYHSGWEDVSTDPIDIEALLHKLMEIFIDYAGKGDAWAKSESLDYGTGFSASIVSRKIDHFYTLGIDKDSIYLESGIAYPESIHKIFDRFVQGIADYSRFGVFAYQENEIFDDSIIRAYRGLLKKKIKGQLPDLLRHYFIAKAERDADFDFGFLEVKWPLNQFSMRQVLTEGCRAFETIHQLNVELWKKSKSRRAKQG
jgi:hypothetical protein